MAKSTHVATAHDTKYTYEQTGYNRLVLGRGSVSSKTSIHPKHSCSLPESLDARVKSNPHKTHAKSMYRKLGIFVEKTFWAITFNDENETGEMFSSMNK